MERAGTLLAAGIATIAMTGAAFAHTSLIPHSHPHGVSALPGVDTIVSVVALAGIATALIIAVATTNFDKSAARKVRRKP